MTKRIISMILILCMVVGMVPVQVFAAEPETTWQQVQETTNPFQDVSEKDWYYDSVMYALENGLLTGTSDTAFSPESTMTRAMFVTVLGRIAEIDLTEYGNPSAFTDVAPGSYYAPYVQWATEKSITSGIGDGRFDPNGLVTREQMATMLVRFFDAYNITYPEATVTTVPQDIDSVAGWAKEAVLNSGPPGCLPGTTRATSTPATRQRDLKRQSFSIAPMKRWKNGLWRLGLRPNRAIKRILLYHKATIPLAAMGAEVAKRPPIIR